LHFQCDGKKLYLKGSADFSSANLEIPTSASGQCELKLVINSKTKRTVLAFSSELELFLWRDDIFSVVVGKDGINVLNGNVAEDDAKET